MRRFPSLSLLVAVVLLLALATTAFAQTGTPTAAANAVSVKDQNVTNNTVMIDKITAAVDGWMVIHADKAGSVGPDIGHAAVKAGDNLNVAVTIDGKQVTAKLYAMLHIDAGVKGTYEFPGADTPVAGATVPFNVTNFAAIAPVAAASPAATAATAVAAAVATVAPAKTVAVVAAPAPSALPTTGGSDTMLIMGILALGGISLLGLGLGLTRRAR